VKLLGYIGINSSILLVTARSVDRFVSVVYPHFYLQKVKPRKLILFNASILGFSSIFASLQLTGKSMDVYLLIDIHLHTTFPLVTTTLCYVGIFLSFRKRSRVDFQRQALESINPTLHDLRRLHNAKKERKISTTSFFILIFLIISLIPYFIAILIDANCNHCGSQEWIEYKMLILTFKAIYGVAPSYICNLIKIRDQTRFNLRSCKELLLQPSRAKTKKTLGDKSFQVAAPGLWNKLPSDIRSIKSYDLFKRTIKTYLFKKAFACYI
ncbi:uncharacterized protein LOC144638992, partial [Oculina patagonica]